MRKMFENVRRNYRRGLITVSEAGTAIRQISHIILTDDEVVPFLDYVVDTDDADPYAWSAYYHDNIIFAIDAIEGNCVYTRCAIWHAQFVDFDTFVKIFHDEVVVMPDGSEVCASDCGEEEEE